MHGSICTGRINHGEEVAGDKIRVLIVDDAKFMVKAICEILESDPDIEVVGTARNGVECLKMIREVRPDVITLDVEKKNIGRILWVGLHESCVQVLFDNENGENDGQ